MNVGFVPETPKKPVASLRNLVPQNTGEKFVSLPVVQPKITVTPQPNEFKPVQAMEVETPQANQTLNRPM